MVITVGIGECAISGNIEDTIVTYALASCVAVTVYNPVKKAAGMIHIALPNPSETQKFDPRVPYYYAVTGIPLMISRLCSEYSCYRNELKIRLFGGANSIREKDVFKLGQKNIEAVERVLKDLKLPYDSTEIGGNLSRTLEMDVCTGIVTVKTQPITI